jgi:general transcription factor IIIA
LKNHVRTAHENVRPFICEVEGCGKTFGYRKVLQRHELWHTQPARKERNKITKRVSVVDEIAGTGYEETGRDITCTVTGCERRFARDYDLQRHLGSVHGQAVAGNSPMPMFEVGVTA